MTTDTDPIESAMSSLRSQPWTGETYNKDLEEKLMREFHTHKPSSRISRHRTLIATLAVLLVGGAAFAAAGGADVVKKFFLDIRIIVRGPDGTVFDGVVELEPVEGEEGTAAATLDLGDGGQTTIEIQEVSASELAGADIPDGEEMTMMTVSLSGLSAEEAEMAKERTIEFMATVHTGKEPIEQTEILEQIAEAEIVVPWTDDNGDDRELYIVREYGEDGTSVVKIFGSRWTEEGDEVFDTLGMVTHLDSLIVEAPTIEFHKDRLTSMTVLCEDGEERVIRFDPDRPHLEGEPATVQITIEGHESGTALEESDWEAEED